MTATTPKRPPMLTATCLYLGLFALIMSISAIDMVTTWNGENSADRVSKVLAALRDAGASQAGAESGYKIFLSVLAVLAAAGVVFAIYTARGDRASRVGLTVVMVITGVFFFAGATGGAFFNVLVGAMSVAFTTRLWRGEAKTWFRQLNGEEPEPVATPPRVDAFANVGAGSAPSHVDEPVASQTPAPQQPPYPAPYYPAPQYAVPPTPTREPMPRSVAIATWTTFIGSALVACLSAMSLLVLGLVGDDYERILRESSFGQSLLDESRVDFDQLVRRSLVLFGICLALSLGGLAASTLALVKRHQGGVFLFVMASVTIITPFVFFPLGIPFTAAAIVVVVQLRKPESRRWFVKT